MIDEEANNFYVGYVKHQYKHEIEEINKKFRYYDRRGNQISYGLFQMLLADPKYSKLREEQIDNFYIITRWAPDKNIEKPFVTTVRDCNSGKTYQREYNNEWDAEKGYKRIANEIIDNTYEFPEGENKS